MIIELRGSSWVAVPDRGFISVVARITLRTRNLPVGAVGPKVTSAMAIRSAALAMVSFRNQPGPLHRCRSSPTSRQGFTHVDVDGVGPVGAHGKLRVGVARRSKEGKRI